MRFSQFADLPIGALFLTLTYFTKMTLARLIMVRFSIRKEFWKLQANRHLAINAEMQYYFPISPKIDASAIYHAKNPWNVALIIYERPLLDFIWNLLTLKVLAWDMAVQCILSFGGDCISHQWVG